MTTSTFFFAIDHLHVRCVSSDDGCLSPRAPTRADVSFFSTLGCSLRGAVTSGSMALALLSPFIWSERALAPVLVCRWPSFHLASSLSLSSPDSWLPQPAAARQQVLGLHERIHALRKHTRLHRVAAVHLDADATHTPTFSLARTPPSRLFLYPLLLVCLCCSHSLSGFFSLFLWSLESGRSRSSSWRGTSCGPEWLRHQLTPVIQHATTSPAAPPLGSSDSVHMTRYNPVLKLEHWIRQKNSNGDFIIIYKSFKWSNMM